MTSVFFILPSEGSFVNGSTQLITTGTANRVEYWAGGEIISESNTGPPFIGSWTPDQNLFGLTTLYAIAYGDNNRISISPINLEVPVSVINQNPSQPCNDGLTINGDDIKICLYAPGKDYVSIKGSWNSQFPNGEIMNLSGDTLWWYETVLEDGIYEYQYNLEGEKYIADPWSENVEWKDPFTGDESANFQHAKTIFEKRQKNNN